LIKITARNASDKGPTVILSIDTPVVVGIMLGRKVESPMTMEMAPSTAIMIDPRSLDRSIVILLMGIVRRISRVFASFSSPTLVAATVPEVDNRIKSSMETAK
jgi:hypothetical protein